MRKWGPPLVALALGCAALPPEPTAYQHNRDDYLAFRAGREGLLEPNYLPFMVYDVPVRPVSVLGALAIRFGLAEPPARRPPSWTRAELSRVGPSRAQPSGVAELSGLVAGIIRRGLGPHGV